MATTQISADRTHNATVAPSLDDYDARLRRSPDWPIARGAPMLRLRRAAFSKPVRRTAFGFIVFFILWYLATAVFQLPRFNFIPNPLYLFEQWTSREPQYGISIFTPDYYEHIVTSVLRVYVAFFLSIALGAPLGIIIGWSKLGRNLFFPLVELLRPIPPLAWVPIAVLIFAGTETPVIFVTMLASFFATVLNMYLGVRSIDENYFRAASCLGYSKRAVLFRVVVPGALPFIFTGMQIAMGVAWFSLVGGELIAGRAGLGYMIFDGYTQVAIPNIFIGMITLGVLGWLSSAMIRAVGQSLMRWQQKSRGEA